LRGERMRRRVVKTTEGGRCGATKDDAKRDEWEADTQVGSWQTREAEEDGTIHFYQASGGMCV
jgi:hypothetical protein